MTELAKNTSAELALPFTDNGQDVMEKVWFPNGRGVSIIRNPCSYGGKAGLFEVAVIQPLDVPCGWDFDYTTPITVNVEGWKDIPGVLDIMRQISELPALVSALPVLAEEAQAAKTERKAA